MASKSAEKSATPAENPAAPAAKPEAKPGNFLFDPQCIFTDLYYKINETWH